MRHMDIFSGVWYSGSMKEVVKSIAGFVAIILVGLAGVTISKVMKLGEMNALIVTVDNVIHTR